MLFNSFEFLLFFPIVTGLYFLLPHRYRWLLLLVASCYFYMAFVPVYILILGGTIVIDYFAGLYIEKQEGRKRKLALVVSIVANVGVLAFFKYWNFLNANLVELLGFFHAKNPVPFLKILLPIGLSFHTFQAMSYTIEVYRRNQKPERHFGIYALYVMFYPQLVAGPIERPQNLLHQFHEEHTFEYRRVVEGLRMILWGLFKKVVIADLLAEYVNQVFDHPHQYHGMPVILASVFFAFQIYCDFSGYSDIAIGSARVMGFTLMRNFNLPYFSSSIHEFWGRWHISLSTWFRDYLYIPLGGNRVGYARWLLNLVIVFMVSGLWHGAKWTFVAWGLLHSIYLVTEIVTKRLRARARPFFDRLLNVRVMHLIGVFITFSLVTYAWIFFRANGLKDALYFTREFFHVDLHKLSVNVTDKKSFVASVALIVFLLIFERMFAKRPFETILGSLRAVPRWTVYITFVWAILLSSVLHMNQQFIYFQF